MGVLLLDSRDSNTFNLAHAFRAVGARVVVQSSARRDRDDVIATMTRESLGLLCIGPGPRAPQDVPGLLQLVHDVRGDVPFFGVCLGLQAMVLERGGTIGRAIAPVHGKVRDVIHDDHGIFAGLPNPMRCMRYHSLIARDIKDLEVSARSDDGEIMALRDRDARAFAVQFHPESIGTEGGLELLAGALRVAGLNARVPPARPGGIPRARHIGVKHA